MSKCKICNGFIGLNICLKCGKKEGAKEELDKLLEEFPDRIVYSYVETRKKQLGGKP